MKKTLAVILLIAVFTGLIALTGCSKSHSIDIYKGVDLTEDAIVTASDNAKDADNLIDGKDSCWDTKSKEAYIEIDFKRPTAFNTVVLQEPTDSVTKFSIHVLSEEGDYQNVYRQDRIDNYRMCVIEDAVSQKVKIVFDEFDKKVSVSNIEVYNIKGQKQDFERQAYYSNGLTAEGITDIQSKKDDPDFKSTLNTLTDVILIGQAVAQADGTIKVGNGMPALKQDVQTIHELTDNKVKVHITIMTGLVDGDFKGNNKAIVKFSKEKLDVYSDNLRVFVEEVNADGIDYDWEYPQLPWEWEAYNKILIATKAAISGRQLSVALWPYGVNLSDEARACIDRVNAMAYDQFDERGDHSSIYESGLWSIDYFLGKGFSKNQLLLGIPFYGRTSDERAYWPAYTEEYGKFDNFSTDHTYTDGEGTFTSTVFLNGYAMVRDKTALAISYDLAGIMIFQLSGGFNYSYEFVLSKAVEETVAQRFGD